LTEVTFGKWLKRQRSSRGLTQEQLAYQIGCATITLRKIESEERRPSVAIVKQLRRVFEIPQDQQTNFLKFARGDWTKIPDIRSGETPWQVPASTRTNLPAAVTSLIGREKQLAEIHGYLLQGEIRLVTLIGPPGIGKTRLSIEVAHQCLSGFADGVFFAGLAPIDDPNLIASTVRQALGYVETQHPSSEQQLIRGVGEKQILIVLDNCEHLIKNVALFTSGFLSACSNLKILTTSREALHISGEWLYSVPSLKLPDEISQVDINSASQYPALTLFAERARAVRSDFSLTADNIKTVSIICAKLDGLPLAIELVAAQLRLHSLQSLLQRMDDSFVLSVQGTWTVPSRQVTLSQAIGWSYHALTPDEQRILAYLSVFSGGFTLSAAETIFSERFTETTVSDLVASLLDKSLLQNSADSKGELRFAMLVTIHQFTWERLTEMNEFSEVRNWHLAYFVHLAEQGDDGIHGPDQLNWMERLDSEYSNFRAALGWAVESQNADDGSRLAGGLIFFWFIRGYLGEATDWYERILALEKKASAKWEAKVLFGLGNLLIRRESGDTDRRTEIFERSLSLYKELNDKSGIAGVLNALGIVALQQQDLLKARQLFNESLVLRSQMGAPWEIAHTLQNFAPIAFQEKDYESAKLLSEETIALFEQAGDQRGVARTLSDLAEFERVNGNLVRAVELLKQSLSQLILFKDKLSITSVLDDLAELSCLQGNTKRAVRLYGAAESMRENIGIHLLPNDPENHEQNIRMIRNNQDEMEFTKAWAEGRSMTMEQAIKYALEEQGI